MSLTWGRWFLWGLHMPSFLWPCPSGVENIKCNTKQIKEICGFLTRQRCFPFGSIMWRNGEDGINAAVQTQSEKRSSRHVKGAWEQPWLGWFWLVPSFHHHPRCLWWHRSSVSCLPSLEIKGQNLCRGKMATNSEGQPISLLPRAGLNLWLRISEALRSQFVVYIFEKTGCLRFSSLPTPTLGFSLFKPNCHC